MPLSDAAFQQWLTGQQDSTRLKDYEAWDNYYHGQFDKIDLPDKLTDALKIDIAITANYAKPIVDAKVQYICGGNLSLEVTSDVETEARAKEAEDFLYRVYRNNRLLFRNQVKAVRIMAKKGDVFLKVVYDEGSENKWSRFVKAFKDVFRRLAGTQAPETMFADKIKVRVLKPDNVYVKYEDDDYEELELAAIVFNEFDDAGNDIPKAQVWYPDVVQMWHKTKKKTGDGDTAEWTSAEWTKMEEEPNPYGFVPIVHIKNTIDDREYGISDIQVMSTIQNVLNKTLTDLVMAGEYTAYQRMAITGSMTQSGITRDVSPGTVMELPNPDAKITIIPGADMTPFLDTVKMLKDTLCEVAQTPMAALGTIEGGNLSGFALRVHWMPLEKKAEEAIAVLTDGFELLNWMLLAMATLHGVGDFAGLDTKVRFKSGLPIDTESIVEQHKIQLENGTISKETAMQEEGIEDVEAERAKIEGENFDLYGGAERARQEAEVLAEQLEGGQIFGTPIPPPTNEEEAGIGEE